MSDFLWPDSGTGELQASSKALRERNILSRVERKGEEAGLQNVGMGP